MDDERTFGKPEVVAANVEKLRAEERSLTEQVEAKKKDLAVFVERFEEQSKRISASRADEQAKYNTTIKSLKDEIDQLTIIVDKERKNTDEIVNKQNEVNAEIKKQEAKKDDFVAEMTDVRQTAEKAKADVIAIQADQSARESSLVKREADFNISIAAHSKEQADFQARIQSFEKRENEFKIEMQALKDEAERVDKKRIEVDTLHNAASVARANHERKSAEAEAKEQELAQKQSQLDALISDNETQKKKNEEERKGLVSWGEDLRAQEVDLKRRQRLSTLNDSP